MGKIFWAVVCVECEHDEVHLWLTGVLKHRHERRASPTRRKDFRESRLRLGMEEKIYGEMPGPYQKDGPLLISILW